MFLLLSSCINLNSPPASSFFLSAQRWNLTQLCFPVKRHFGFPFDDAPFYRGWLNSNCLVSVGCKLVSTSGNRELKKTKRFSNGWHWKATRKHVKVAAYEFVRFSDMPSLTFMTNRKPKYYGKICIHHFCFQLKNTRPVPAWCKRRLNSWRSWGWILAR